MKLKTSLIAFLLLGTLFTACKKESADEPEEFGPGTPAPGSKRVITQDIEYYSGLIEGSTSWATWPIAKFPVDASAVKYSVKVMKSGKTYTWKNGDKTACEYYVFPGVNDIKGGFIYCGLGRTWCAGCTEPDPIWEANYRSRVFPVGENKVEITFYY